MDGGVSAWGWGIFGATVAILLVIDLWVHRERHAESKRAAVVWSIIWIAAGLAFYGFVWIRFGTRPAQEYLAAYLIEKSLSLDNLFVFLIIFRMLCIPHSNQHRALFWGIIGALVFRALFIYIGGVALERWEWVSYVFGGILALAAIHAFRENPAEDRENTAVKWLAKHLPVSHDHQTSRFITFEDGRRKATPLLIAILGLELTDVLFAIDSVPAAFSVTEPGEYRRFIVYSSNVFAILGLRALYIVLAHTIANMRYLHYGLAAVLAFAAFKMMAHDWVDIPPLASVGIIVFLIGASVWASLRHRKREANAILDQTGTTSADCKPLQDMAADGTR